MIKKLTAIMMGFTVMAGVLSGCSGNAAQSSQAPAPKEASMSAQTSAEEAQTDSTTDWPTKTVQVVVTASAGGDTDFNARTFATYFEKYTGKSMVITNTPGGGGSVATSEVKNAKNDGYKILFCHTGQMIVNEVAGLIDYNMDDFDIAGIPAIDKGTVLVASAQSGITSIDDLVAKAKTQPGKISYASELGGYSHLQALILMKQADIELKILDIGSSSEKITNLLGGRVDLAAISYGAVKDYAETGDLVILGQYNNERNENLGDVPTFKESNLNVAMEKPYIISFPKGTDPAIIEKMNALTEQIAADEDYKKDLLEGYKQPVDYLLKDDAIALLKTTRDDFMSYREDLLK
ncbi:tripartite tricarboxylate transporter substrate binding protein [Cellulosilyticum sp. I15G10I2]|uniref:tripartite tricarboxylate transporter substrate binding protein n=1 Tax=Cellulosilyticum sp. I15G10I2 TaxID=1892843 RepID=UPI000A591DD4|nr:tripartite tricarboxylate transporter substrate binding protein [Cellulosilyticum sp. I15G10I2]